MMMITRSILFDNSDSSPAFLIRYGRTEQHMQSYTNSNVYIHTHAHIPMCESTCWT